MKPVRSLEDRRRAYVQGAGTILCLWPPPSPAYYGWSGWKSLGTIQGALMGDYMAVVGDFERLLRRNALPSVPDNEGGLPRSCETARRSVTR